MKKIIGLSLILTLTGCANIDSFNQRVGNTLNVNDRTTASTIGAGIMGTAAGCAIGALSGSIAKGCLAGAAAGVVGGYALSVSQQLEEAKQLKAEIDQQRLSGMDATIKSSPVKSQGVGSSSDRKLDEMVINIPKEKVYDESVERVLVKAAKISSASKKDVHITVFGPAKEASHMTSILRNNSASQVAIDQRVSPKTYIKITPIPEV
ncbi:hypothetical protein [Serratia sp. Se-RSBMAAmG]|uniref:hypothetical protein n=1 Tax=Serratia sp. Se-RSBMAAmG TaxID=3043305 RepID=UPI0024AF29C8|nr:hypothetical protein [Serratia sp. Se-RSBMAAmG]MDI6976671.1 hypothetical protein [Serratia sp. Se-RSBMAAmG]